MTILLFLRGWCEVCVFLVCKQLGWRMSLHAKSRQARQENSMNLTAPSTAASPWGLVQLNFLFRCTPVVRAR